MRTDFSSKKQKEKYHWEELRVGRKIMLKWVWKLWVCVDCVVMGGLLSKRE